MPYLMKWIRMKAAAQEGLCLTSLCPWWTLLYSKGMLGNHVPSRERASTVTVGFIAELYSAQLQSKLQTDRYYYHNQQPSTSFL